MAVPIVMPKLGMVMTEGTIAKLSKNAGDSVARGEVIAEIETEKLNYDLEATEAGIFHPVVTEGAIVQVDGVVGYLLAEGEDPPKIEDLIATKSAEPHKSFPTTAQQRESAAPEVRVRSTPGARKLSAKLEVDISKVTPTGPGGRVVEEDVRKFKVQGSPDALGSAGPVLPSGLPSPAKTVAITGMRKSIADHMRGSIASTAQLSFVLEIDVTDAQQMRDEVSKDKDAVITMAHVMIKACVDTIKDNPGHNSVLVDGNIIQFDEVNIGVAVALKEGLIVPVLKGADKKNILEISDGTYALAVKAREGTLSPDEVSGGTFTISVLGTVDGFTPILNASQNAILGVGRVVKKPIVKDDQMVIREMITVSLTVDHQAIDGAVAAAFLGRLKEILEHPGSLFK